MSTIEPKLSIFIRSEGTAMRNGEITPQAKEVIQKLEKSKYVGLIKTSNTHQQCDLSIDHLSLGAPLLKDGTLDWVKAEQLLLRMGVLYVDVNSKMKHKQIDL